MPRSLKITPLDFQDEDLGALDVPGGRVRLLRGLGSGLARRAGDPPGAVWAVGDRGPNVSLRTAVERWGLADLARHGALDGAKVMPRPDVGPALAELRVEDAAVRLARVLPLRGLDGRPLSGLPVPGGPHAISEPALDLAGAEIAPDPSGADTEGLAACVDGGFWVGDEYGPSLLRVAPDGRVLFRWVPAGTEPVFAGAGHPTAGVLPALAARRRLNRGFEALALSTDERRLHLAFQSPLAHPDKTAWERGRHVRIWTLDADAGTVLAQHLYPLDPPESFQRDRARAPLAWSDLKVSEMTVLGSDQLLLLERGSASTKLYAVSLRMEEAVLPDHLALETRPTLEELSARGELDKIAPVLRKTLVLDTDRHPEIGPDLEGMVLLGQDELLLVNDNDFGVEGVETRFWRVSLDARWRADL